MTGKHLDRAEKIRKLFQTTGAIDVFHLHSGISESTSWRASTSPNVHEWWTQPLTREMPICSCIDVSEIR